MRYIRNESLKKHSSFRIGGQADFFCAPKNIKEIREALGFAKEQKFEVAVLGAGTNLLMLDAGFRGLVVKTGGLNWIRINGNRVFSGAGLLLPQLIRVLSKKGLGGLEFLAGIPGSVGGAVIMNAGAWGRGIGEFVEKVMVLNRNGDEQVVEAKRLSFGYRRSRLQEKNWIVTEVVFKLRRKKKKLIQNKIKENLLKRRNTQPLGSPNCGSIFKNPKGDFAGRLIEAAGCKGMRIGDAQVSAKHANFIVNLGEAKARDVIKLMALMQRMVKDKFKIKLEPEIKIMLKSPR